MLDDPAAAAADARDLVLARLLAGAPRRRLALLDRARAPEAVVRARALDHARGLRSTSAPAAPAAS